MALERVLNNMRSLTSAALAPIPLANFFWFM